MDSSDAIEAGRLLYHHCMDLADVSYDLLVADPTRYEPDHKAANEWLAEQTGFWPFFLGVGDSLQTYWITGYDHNWRRVVSSSLAGSVLRKAGESPNLVLFSFEHVDGVFMDYSLWFLVINADDIEREIGLVQTRSILRPAWSKRRWLRRTMEVNPGSVMLVAPSLDLRVAGRIWVRNRATQRILQGQGFSNVEVHRIPVFNG